MRGGKRHGAGRRKGSMNTKTIQWKEFGKKLMESGTVRAQKILDKCNDHEFMFYFLKLIEFFEPKARQSVDLKVVAPEVEELLQMDDARLNRYIDDILKQKENEQINGESPEDGEAY